VDDTKIAAGEKQLWDLIEERMRPGADVAGIDDRIWATFGQTWTVMFTDLTGFSRMVAEFGIIHFLQEIHEQRTLFLPIVASHGGILLKEEADSMLLIFPEPERAIACAIAMNHRSTVANEGRTPEDKVLLCAGIGHGRVLRVGRRDVFGQEVNAASKLGEDIAKAGEILITDALRVAVGELPGLRYEPLPTSVPGSAKNYQVIYPMGGSKGGGVPT
jgi:adenylate cyclase